MFRYIRYFVCLGFSFWETLAWGSFAVNKREEKEGVKGPLLRLDGDRHCCEIREGKEERLRINEVPF